MKTHCRRVPEVARATLRRFEGSRYTTKHGKGVHDKDGTGPRRLNQSTETKSPTKNHKQIRNAQAIIHWGSSCGGRVEVVWRWCCGWPWTRVGKRVDVRKWNRGLRRAPESVFSSVRRRVVLQE